MTEPLRRVALLSADPWDEVWRRNQHLATQLVRQGLVQALTYVNPPTKLAHRSSFEPEPGIRVVTPHLLLPRHRGGLELLARETRRTWLRSVDALWINDATLGLRCLRPGLRAVYDVTDDWRTAALTAIDRAHLVAAEDALARSVRTIVCSDVLRDRWIERYGVRPEVIHNGVDTDAHARAFARELEGEWPRSMYVGTLHEDRLDIELLLELAAGPGAVHLVGPDHLRPEVRHKLVSTLRVHVHGQVPYADVPGWMASADVLICPHRVTEFTMSLDAIKSFEYLASGRPTVATPTSGFQVMVGQDGIHVVDRDDFAETTARAAGEPVAAPGRGGEHDWASRARDFADQLVQAGKTGA